MRPRRIAGKNQKPDKVYIYGKHALAEALENTPYILRKVFLAPDVRDKELLGRLAAAHIPVAELSGVTEGLAGRDAVHQGVIAIIDPDKLMQPFDRFLESLVPGSLPAIAVLAEVQDPHNVGAVIRSAAAFGLSAVLVPTHNQAGITGAVVKTSAGMAFRIPLVSIGNVNHALAVLKEKGFWIYGLAMDGATPLLAEAFEVPAAFVIGNEGRGIRTQTLASCDVTLSIPMHGRTESLNAAVSAGVVFYEWSKKHPEALLPLAA
jgi:23S rRNA (guanosine2251-2'-O)-methyltransferase